MPGSIRTGPQRTALSRAFALTISALVIAACGTTSPSPVSTASAGTPVASPTATTSTGAGPTSAPTTSPAGTISLAAREFDVPAGSHPHDVAPAADGGIWYTGQHNGVLGQLDPATGAVREIPLGSGSAPHGVIVGPDGAAWITDGGLNAIVRVDPATDEVRAFPLPVGPRGRQPQHGGLRPRRASSGSPASPASTAASTRRPARCASSTPREGRGPYGITATPDGDVWYASLAGSHIARIDPATGEATIDRATDRQARARAASGRTRTGRIWVSEWNAGQVGVYDPATGTWQEWQAARRRPAGLRRLRRRPRHRLADRLRRQRDRPLRPDDRDVRRRSRCRAADATVRQLLGRPGEVWGAESATDKLVVITEG